MCLWYAVPVFPLKREPPLLWSGQNPWLRQPHSPLGAPGAGRGRNRSVRSCLRHWTSSCWWSHGPLCRFSWRGPWTQSVWSAGTYPPCHRRRSWMVQFLELHLPVKHTRLCDLWTWKQVHKVSQNVTFSHVPWILFLWLFKCCLLW